MSQVVYILRSGDMKNLAKAIVKSASLSTVSMETLERSEPGLAVPRNE